MKPEKLLDHNYTPESLQQAIAEVQARITARQQKLVADRQPIEDKKAQVDQLCRGYASAVAGYVELGEFDISIKLVDGLRIATLHCKLEGGRP